MIPPSKKNNDGGNGNKGGPNIVPLLSGIVHCHCREPGTEQVQCCDVLGEVELYAAISSIGQ